MVITDTTKFRLEINMKKKSKVLLKNSIMTDGKFSNSRTSVASLAESLRENMELVQLIHECVHVFYCHA